MNVFRPFHTVLIAIMIAAMLGGCGYKLRGAIDLPESMQRVYVQSDSRNQEFLAQLKKSLALSGADVLNAPAADATTLRLLSVDENRATTGHDANRDAAQYRIGVTVRFTTDGSTSVMSAQTSQTLNYDPSQPVVMERQERTLFQQMYNTVTQQMMRQLSRGG